MSEEEAAAALPEAPLADGQMGKFQGLPSLLARKILPFLFWALLLSGVILGGYFLLTEKGGPAGSENIVLTKESTVSANPDDDLAALQAVSTPFDSLMAKRDAEVIIDLDGEENFGYSFFICKNLLHTAFSILPEEDYPADISILAEQLQKNGEYSMTTGLWYVNDLPYETQNGGRQTLSMEYDSWLIYALILGKRDKLPENDLLRRANDLLASSIDNLYLQTIENFSKNPLRVLFQSYNEEFTKALTEELQQNYRLRLYKNRICIQLFSEGQQEDIALLYDPVTEKICGYAGYFSRLGISELYDVEIWKSEDRS